MKNVATSRRLLLGGMTLCIFLFAVIPYLYVLQLPLTAIDTIPTIAASRASSIGEAFSVLLRELRGGISDESYYRPLTLVTYTLDYAIWGWEARGYHLTDLMLHGCAAVSVFWMSLIAFDRKPWEAFCVSALFILHPATIDVVPAVARRQEPMLVVGFAIALIGARGLGVKKHSWMLTLVGTLIAISSVERGLVLPAVVFAYVFIYRENPEPLPARFRRALIWSLPFGLCSIAFYALRYLLFTQSGVNFSPSNLISIPKAFVVALVIPQQIQITDPIWKPPGWMQAVLAVLVAIMLLTAVWKSERRSTYLFAGAWLALYCLLLSLASLLLPWYFYTAAVPLSLFLVSMVWEGVSLLRPFQRRFFVMAPVCLLALMQVIIITATSPVLRAYPGWQVAGSLSQSACASLLDVAAELPDDTGIVLINVPSHYRESNSNSLVTCSAAILWPRSIQAWVSSHSVGNKVVVWGSSQHFGNFAVPTVELRGNDKLWIYFKDDQPSTYGALNRRRVPSAEGRGVEFHWPPRAFKDRPFKVYVFDGVRFVPREFPAGGAVQ